MEFKGIVNITNPEYHAELDHLSSSSYKLLLTDLPKFYKERILKEKRKEVDNPNFIDGSYLHSLILEPDSVEKEYSIFPGFRKAGKEWEDFKAGAEPGKVLLSRSQSDKVKGWHRKYLENKVAVDLISGGEAEVSLFGEYRGIPTKVRADYVNRDRGYILDVKTTSHGLEVDDFKLTMGAFGYQLSAALYLSLFEDYYNQKLDFLFLVVGKTERGCRVFKLSDKSREYGEAQLIAAAKIYKNCIKTGIWVPSEIKEEYSDEIEEV